VVTLLVALLVPLLVPLLALPLLVVVAAVVVAAVVVAAVVVATLAVVRLRESAGSFPLINVIAIASHAATNRATAPVTTRERISRVRCALVMRAASTSPVATACGARKRRV
jgi:hypothetical protein